MSTFTLSVKKYTRYEFIFAKRQLMTAFGYIRASTERQDLDKQPHLLLEYPQEQRLQINVFVEVEISSRKSQRERRIAELLERLQSGDLLLVAELRRMGRNMLETLKLINTLHEKGVQLAFVRQPEKIDIHLGFGTVCEADRE